MWTKRPSTGDGLLLPCRGGDHLLVLCDTYQVPSAEDAGSATELKPHTSNNRVFCDSAMRAAAASAPVFSCQQQYTLLNPQTHYPVGKQQELWRMSMRWPSMRL